MSLPLDIIQHHLLPLIPLDWIYVSKIFSQLSSELLLTDSRVIPNKNDNEPIKKAANLGLSKTFKMLINDPRVDVAKSLPAIVEFDRKELFDLIDWDKYKDNEEIYDAYRTAIRLNRFEMFRQLLRLGFCQMDEQQHLIVDSSAFAYLARYDNSYNKEMVRYIFKLMNDTVPTESTYNYTDILRAAVRSGDSEVYGLFRRREFYYYDTLMPAAIQYKKVPLVEELLESHMLGSITKHTLLMWALNSQDVNVIKCVLKKIDVKELPASERAWYIYNAKQTEDEEIIEKLSFK